MIKEIIRCEVKPTEFHFKNYHVFVDHNFLDYAMVLMKMHLRGEHRMHIFVSRKSINTISDELLGKFVRESSNILNRRIIVHVPLCDRDLVDKIYDSIGRPSWKHIKLFVERDGIPYLFKMNENSFLEVSSIAFFHQYNVDILNIEPFFAAGWSCAGRPL